MNEFALIQTYFNKAQHNKNVLVGIGDDCAVLEPPLGQALAVSIDTQLAGRHFPNDAAPDLIAARTLHCAVSDLAAMGAEPLWFTLALTLPASDSAWLERFSYGLFEAAENYRISLVGGDTTAGPLTISIQVHGGVPQHSKILRSGAKPGDGIFVTGPLGDGAAGLAVIQERIQVTEQAERYLKSRFYQPRARVRSGLLLRNVATACIDVSDGLLADLGHICKASDVAAVIDSSRLPLSSELSANVPTSQALEWALTGGDDYQLCFTADAEELEQLQKRVHSDELDVSCIGEIAEGKGIINRNTGGAYSLNSSGFKHFT